MYAYIICGSKPGVQVTVERNYIRNYVRGFLAASALNFGSGFESVKNDIVG